MKSAQEELPQEARQDRVGTFFPALWAHSLPVFKVSFFFFFRGCPWGPQIVLVDDRECLVGKSGQGDAPHPTPVNLDLDWVLGKMPQKVCEPGKGCILQWPFWHTDVPLPLFVTSVPCPSRCLHLASSISGVLPPEKTPCAAAFGFAPRAECAAGSGPGPQAACCGQQTLPH